MQLAGLWTLRLSACRPGTGGSGARLCCPMWSPWVTYGNTVPQCSLQLTVPFPGGAGLLPRRPEGPLSSQTLISPESQEPAPAGNEPPWPLQGHRGPTQARVSGRAEGPRGGETGHQVSFWVLCLISTESVGVT